LLRLAGCGCRSVLSNGSCRAHRSFGCVGRDVGLDRDDLPSAIAMFRYRVAPNRGSITRPPPDPALIRDRSRGESFLELWRTAQRHPCLQLRPVHHGEALSLDHRRSWRNKSFGEISGLPQLIQGINCACGGHAAAAANIDINSRVSTRSRGPSRLLVRFLLVATAPTFRQPAVGLADFQLRPSPGSTTRTAVADFAT